MCEGHAYRIGNVKKAIKLDTCNQLIQNFTVTIMKC